MTFTLYFRHFSSNFVKCIHFAWKKFINAHLYINGVKIQRIYGHALHLPANLFKSGINTVSVTLNNHGHMYWTAQGKKIVATLYVNDQTKEFITYRFESFPSKVENTH